MTNLLQKLFGTKEERERKYREINETARRDYLLGFIEKECPMIISIGMMPYKKDLTFYGIREILKKVTNINGWNFESAIGYRPSIYRDDGPIEVACASDEEGAIIALMKRETWVSPNRFIVFPEFYSSFRQVEYANDTSISVSPNIDSICDIENKNLRKFVAGFYTQLGLNLGGTQ
jgi:hypothetical protein